MGYLHCHNCNWSQDSFWSYVLNWKHIKRFITFKWQDGTLGYNPLSVLLENIKYYIKPRFIYMDSSWAKEMGFKSTKIHSWWFFIDGFKRFFYVRKNMLYKTYNDFRKAKKINIASCPNCKSKTDWDID